MESLQTSQLWQRRIWMSRLLSYYSWSFQLVLIPVIMVLTFFGWDSLPIYYLLGIAASQLLTGYLAWGVVAPILLWVYLLVSYTLNNSLTAAKIWPTFSILLLMIFLGIGKLIMNMVNHRRLTKYAKDLSPLSDTQIFFSEELMKKSGLTDDEIKFFKSDVNKRYRNYLYLRSVAGQMAEIVPNYGRSIELIQGIFRELAETPQLMLEMDNFLYKHLDEYTQITQQIVNLQDNLIKEDEDQQLIDRAGKKLVAMEADFVADYQQVTENEREALRKLN